ncbi:MAG: chemotaxis protein CheW [Erythrobacter sp.]
MNELLVMTQIAGRRCALSANDVKSVIELTDPTPVPCTPDFIRGIAAVRSKTLTVVDCRLAIGLNASDFPTDHRAAAVEIDGHMYALIVDAIDEVATSISEPEQVAGGFGPEWSRVACGMVETDNGPAIWLNLDALVEGPKVAWESCDAAA